MRQSVLVCFDMPDNSQTNIAFRASVVLSTSDYNYFVEQLLEIKERYENVTIEL